MESKIGRSARLHKRYLLLGGLMLDSFECAAIASAGNGSCQVSGRVLSTCGNAKLLELLPPEGKSRGLSTRPS
jgi:hypothetical protein